MCLGAVGCHKASPPHYLQLAGRKPISTPNNLFIAGHFVPVSSPFRRSIFQNPSVNKVMNKMKCTVSNYPLSFDESALEFVIANLM